MPAPDPITPVHKDHYSQVQHNIDATGLNSTPSVSCERYSSMHIQVVWADHADTSDFEIQSSIDGTNWDTVTGSSTTTSGADGSESIVINPNAFKSVRVTVTEVDAAGDYAVYFFQKRVQN